MMVSYFSDVVDKFNDYGGSIMVFTSPIRGSGTLVQVMFFRTAPKRTKSRNLGLQ